MVNRIHITSSGPRTGSTLLMEVMKTCFQIDCSCKHEASLAQSNSSFGKCNTVITKQPSSTHRLRKLLDRISNLYVICIIRDPRDMVVSYHGRIEDKYYCGLNYWKAFIKHYPELIEHPRFIVVQYEEFTQNPDKVQEFLQSKIPFLSKKCDFSEYHLHANPDPNSVKALKTLRPIESKGIGNWKNHLPRLKQQLEKHGSISDSLKTFNYEQNSDWLGRLDGVNLEYFSTFKDENSIKKMSLKSYFLTRFNFFWESIGLNPYSLLSFLKSVGIVKANKSET